MKKIFALIVLAAAFAACQKESKPEQKQEVKDPVADFVYEINGLSVTFTNKSTDAIGYKWEFGDEETSKEANPTHEYAAAGEYTVKLTAANSEGVTAKKEATFTLAGVVKAYFSVSPIEGRDGEFGKALKFDATSSENADAIAWDFGDGTTSAEFSPVHVFPTFGKFTVQATLSNAAGGSDTYTQQVECVKNTVLIKGGSMNEEDSKYWTAQPHWGYDNGQYVEVEGVYAYASKFGNTDVDLGHGAVLKFESNPLGWDFNNKASLTQVIEVREGDVLEIDCLTKWGEETQDNGHFSLRVVYGDKYEKSSPGTAIFWFEHFWGVHDPEEGSTTPRYCDWVPAFEGNMAACVEALGADYGAGPDNDAEMVNGKLRYTATQSGKLMLVFHINQVWGYSFGAGRDIYLDEVSVCAVVD